MKKRLYKSTTDKKIFGVCGGLADYFNIDPVILRVIWAVLALCYGTGIVLYLVMAFVLPKDTDAPRVIDVESDVREPRDKYKGPEID